MKKWDVLKGFLTQTGRVGFGVYVDIGIFKPFAKDALYPLHRMRAQLADGEQRSAREIVIANAFCDYYPVKTIVTDIDQGKLTVELADDAREAILSWRQYPWDRVIMVGLTREQAAKTVREMGLWQDIINIETLSLFVQSLVLKIGTEAPGIISKIGNRLRGVRLTAYTQHKQI